MDQASETGLTWEDYRKGGDDERWELIDGHPYAMTPAPGTLHQEVIGSFYLGMAVALRGKRCRVYLSPTDVRLSDRDVVQPDLLVVCDRGQVLSTHVDGPPTIAVEVLSPTSGRHDRIRKLRLYVRAGVAEYWIVSPMPPMLEVLVLDGDSYRVVGVHADQGRFQSPTVPDLDLDLAELFDPCDTSGLEEVREFTPSYVASR